MSGSKALLRLGADARIRDGIRGCTDLRCSVQAHSTKSAASSRRRLKRGAIRLQRHLPREPLMVVFQTAKLRRGVQMFRPTRSNADGRQITTIFTMSSVFRATDQPPTRSALLTANWRGCDLRSPSTLGDDGDPLDMLILMDEPVVPGCVIKAR